MTHLPPENVQEYPRPPALQPVAHPLRIDFAGRTIAETAAAWRVLETHHPPTYYLPQAAFLDGVLEPAPGSSHCEWKGRARYWNVVVGDARAARAAWSYPDPVPAFGALRDQIAIYPGAMEACWVGDIRVTPQPGGFYGGWVTPNLTGRIKGARGTEHW